MDKQAESAKGQTLTGYALAVLWTLLHGLAAVFVLDEVMPRAPALGPYLAVLAILLVVSLPFCTYLSGLVWIDEHYEMGPGSGW